MSQTASNPFDIKSASLDLLALILKTSDFDLLSRALAQRFGAAGKTAAVEGFVIDIEAIEHPEDLDFARLIPLLLQHGIYPLGLRHPDPAVAAQAARNQLPYLPETPRAVHGATSAAEESTAPQHKAAPAPQPQPARPAAEPALLPSMIIDRPVRAGQQIYAKGASLVVLDMVSAGAEIIADGDIHVYAPLRGRALAGARGNTSARIFARSMEAELVSIAGVYRTLEQVLPDSIRGKSTQVFLENERLVMTALGQ
jgi:septum site-determining protein MinC